MTNPEDRARCNVWFRDGAYAVLDYDEYPGLVATWTGKNATFVTVFGIYGEIRTLKLAEVSMIDQITEAQISEINAAELRVKQRKMLEGGE